MYCLFLMYYDIFYLALKVKTKGQNEGEKLLEPQLRFKEFKNNYYYEQIKNLITNKAETYNPLKDVTSHKCIELENINPDSGSINGYTNSIDLKSTNSLNISMPGLCKIEIHTFPSSYTSWQNKQ